MLRRRMAVSVIVTLILIGSIATIGWFVGLRPAPVPAAVPIETSVILISLDTLRADRLNCYGYTKRETSPNIDLLAEEGILFENHFSSASWTTPSHISLFTSLIPTAHGVTQSLSELEWRMESGATFNMLPDKAITLAEELNRLGCATAAFTGGGSMHPGIGFGQGFEKYVTSQFKLDQSNMAPMFDWLDARGRAPFFLFWHTFEVHGPYVHADFIDEFFPPGRVKKLRAALLRFEQQFLSDVSAISELDELHKRFLKLLIDHGAYRPKVCEALYCGGVRSADRWVGELIDRLRRGGRYDNTMIILTSDHGEEFSERSRAGFYNYHGHTLFDEIVHVPLIIKLPEGRHAGTRVSDVVRSIDVMPTVLDVLGRRPLSRVMQGRSLRPMWEESGERGGQFAVSESVLHPLEQKSVRTGGYKLICTIDAATVERYGRAHLPGEMSQRALYDLRADPAEKENLLEGEGNPEAARIADALEQHLRSALKRRRGRPDTTELDAETMDALKALGYVH